MECKLLRLSHRNLFVNSIATHFPLVVNFCISEGGGVIFAVTNYKVSRPTIYTIISLDLYRETFSISSSHCLLHCTVVALK